DELTQGAKRAELDPANGALALADQPRDLIGRVALEETKNDDLLLERRELPERRSQRGLVRAGEDLEVGVDRVVHLGMQERVFEGDLSAAAADVIDDGVARDTVEPGEERLTRLVPRDRSQGLHAHVTREV